MKLRSFHGPIRDRNRLRPELAQNDSENPANHISTNHSLDQSYEDLQTLRRVGDWV